jgi:CFEM-containing surface protein
MKGILIMLLYVPYILSQNVPTCALTCISNANLGDCAQTDNACLCKNQQFIASTTTCIESTCTGSDLQEAIEFVQAICAAAV